MEFSLNLNTRRQAEEKNTFTANSIPRSGEILQYNWSTSAGKLNQTSGRSVKLAGAQYGRTVASITVKVSNQDNTFHNNICRSAGKRYKYSLSNSAYLVSFLIQEPIMLFLTTLMPQHQAVTKVARCTRYPIRFAYFHFANKSRHHLYR